ncbi:hypothetical protein [Streptomyces mirabilis]|uniref:hypothetical protein n=1 Tax=Streptomyces mirabilis TaxID=68239 RepID=UPI0036A816EC
MAHAEIEITAELVQDLLPDQHPDLADRPLRLGARGWGNHLWRLGDDPAVRDDAATATDWTGPALLVHGDVKAPAICTPVSACNGPVSPRSPSGPSSWPPPTAPTALTTSCSSATPTTKHTAWRS